MGHCWIWCIINTNLLWHATLGWRIFLCVLLIIVLGLWDIIKHHNIWNQVLSFMIYNNMMIFFWVSHQ